jgi:hypothetical protein
MNDPQWPETVAAWLRAHGLPEAFSEPFGAVCGLPGIRALAMPLGGSQSPYASTELLAAAIEGSTPFVVIQPRPDAPVSAAFCTIPLAALVRLLTGEAPADRPEQERVTVSEDVHDGVDVMSILATAVGALANTAAGSPLSTADMLEGFDPLAVVEVLTVFGLSALRSMLSPEQVAGVLSRLGLVAAGGEL